MSDTILSISNLEKTYPNGVRALKGINLKVKKGEFLVVIGLSGSGKSTLLRCINRLHEPTKGEIVFIDQNEKIDISKLNSDFEIRGLRKRIGMIFQHFNLIPRHTVISNVLMGKLSYLSTWKSIFGLFTNDQIQDARKYLKLVGIEDKANIRADQLSGGQQQRVAIARALSQSPQILLADEPVASLDPATCHVVMDYLKKANQELGITIICNLHFLSLVRQYATRVIALKAGEIVYEGSPIDINDQWFEQIYGNEAKEVHIN
jgi:phosphonate transport system ATP-binding protein